MGKATKKPFRANESLVYAMQYATIFLGLLPFCSPLYARLFRRGILPRVRFKNGKNMGGNGKRGGTFRAVLVGAQPGRTRGLMYST